MTTKITTCYLLSITLWNHLVRTLVSRERIVQ